MIQIGILELLIVVLVILFSVKPEKLMHYIKSIFSFFLQIQNFFTSTKEDIEKELNIQELKQDIHNEKRMKELEKMNEGLSTHFLELRNRILYSFSFFVIAFVCIYPFNNYFFNNIVDYLQTFTTIDLIAVEVASPFIVPLKLSAFIAALISIPFLLYQTLAFMSPGLYPKERSVIFSRTIIGSLLFFRGWFLLSCCFAKCPQFFSNSRSRINKG